MVANGSQEGAVSDVITEFFNSSMSPEAARSALAQAVLER
jgi:hypothetical protein